MHKLFLARGFTVLDVLKIVYVEWEDSSTTFGWHEEHDDEPLVIQSVGILVREGKKSVTLSTSRAVNGDYVDQITIPRRAIRTMRKVAGVKNEGLA